MISYTNYQRRCVVDAFSNGQTFYRLKELEILVKDKDILPNVLKNIVQNLVSENTLQSDKFGSVQFYWLPLEKKYQEDLKKIEELKHRNTELFDRTSVVKKALMQKEEIIAIPNEESKLKRERLTNELEALKSEEFKLLEFLNTKNISSVEEINILKANIQKLLVAINRWTDNIFSMKSWFKRRFPALMDENLEQEFNIPSELDYFSLN